MKTHHKIVTCASYGFTGSSLITDLLKEFETTKSMGDFEFAIAHEVDGLSDLQHYVVEDFHRLKVDEAIYRFKRLVNNIGGGYQAFFNNKFFEFTDEYLNSIIDVTWQGFWHQQTYRYSKLGRKVRYEYPAKLHTLFYRAFGKKHGYEFIPYFKRSEMNFLFSRERFFDNTRDYTEKLFNELDPEYKYEYIVLDQLVPPSNTDRYLRYFNDLKIIVVDRDPRDLYLLNKLFWHEGWIPTEDVNTYIKWFRLMREHIKYEKDDPQRVLRVKFEDFIYNYEDSVAKIMEFLQLAPESHTGKQKHFNPNVSIKNTRLWEKYGQYEEDIKLIEEQLAELCYKL